MAKVKIPRKSISLDMTAMCDMAFLLLTFFILTAQMKPTEAVIVDMPKASSQKKLEEIGVIQISISKDGKIFFGIDGQSRREDLLKSMSKIYKVNFSETEKKNYKLGGVYGVPMSEMPKILRMSQNELANKPQKGIPIDSTSNQLAEWIRFSRVAFQRDSLFVKGLKEKKNNLKVVIRADVGTNYKVVKEVIATLQKQGINRFHLVTNLKS
jgi:biopolymer transport protein ExbD